MRDWSRSGWCSSIRARGTSCDQQQGAFETNRAATDRARDKTKSLGMDRPHVEETRWTCGQEGTGVEPTGEAKERETPAHLATYENSRVGREETSHME